MDLSPIRFLLPLSARASQDTLSHSCSIVWSSTFVCTLPRRQIKGNCAESFTEYWTCLDYSNLAELRHCRKQQKAFDSCVLDKLGWERPDLGDLSKVSPAKCGVCAPRNNRVNGGKLIKACTKHVHKHVHHVYVISGERGCFFAYMHAWPQWGGGSAQFH